MYKDSILSAKSENVLSTFFLRPRRTKVPSHVEPFGLSHIYVGPQMI